MSKVGVAAFVMAMGLALPAAAQLDGPVAMPQGGPLNAAKDLYASARYDEGAERAQRAPDRRRGRSPGGRAVRSLCLLALGRASEAETAIAAVVKEDPTYRPGESESPRGVPPSEVRKRLLRISRPPVIRAPSRPTIGVMGRGRGAVPARAGVDRRSGQRRPAHRFAGARRGFLELSARAAAPHRHPGRAETGGRRSSLRRHRPAAPAGPVPGKIYTADDEAVTPAVVIEQDIPRFPTTMAMARSARSRGCRDRRAGACDRDDDAQLDSSDLRRTGLVPQRTGNTSRRRSTVSRSGIAALISINIQR